MEDIKARIKDAILCGRYPEMQDIVDFWNSIEKDFLESPSFNFLSDSESQSLDEIEKQIEACERTRHDIIAAKNNLSKIKYFLPASIGFSLIRANDKLNLALVHIDTWQKSLFFKKHVLK